MALTDHHDLFIGVKSISAGQDWIIGLLELLDLVATFTYGYIVLINT